MKTTLWIIAMLLLSHSFAQQESCGTDQVQQNFSTRFPGYAEKERQNNQLIYQFLSSERENGEEKTIYTIPVVFHIMHQGGPENIPDATVIQAVSDLNQRFQNSGQFYDATGHVADIQFCLASVDPWGNPTTGITHDYSSLLSIDYYDYFEDWTLKTQNRWNPQLYLNIWTVGSIVALPGMPGAVGYSTYPGGNMEVDGIVVRYTIANSSLLAHEVGHYLNLYHTFSGGCTNFNCMLDGDYVCDTPPDNSSDYSSCQGNSCSTETDDTTGYNPFPGDVDELPNYMDYSSCTLSFTDGQVQRMRSALTLLRPSILQSNGCGAHPGGMQPIASFIVDSSFCKGTGKYGFYSTSSNSLYTAWDFDSNGTIDTVGEIVTHHFSSSGLYHVKLYVNGYGGMDTLTQTIMVFVANTPYYPISGSVNGTNIDPILSIPYACIGAQVTLAGTPGMSSYLWSNGATTQNTTFTIDTSTSLSLTVTDPSGGVYTSCQDFEIGVNPRPHLVIEVGADTMDCGDLITIRLHPIPYWFPGNNTWYRDGNWMSANQLVLSSHEPVGDHHVWVANNIDPIGCATNSDTLHYFVNDPEPITLNFDGTSIWTNYTCIAQSWYKDGQLLATNQDSSYVITENGCYWCSCVTCTYLTTDTICITDLSLNALGVENGMRVYPNPFSDKFTVQFTGEQNGFVRLLDTAGKCIRTILVNGKELVISREGLSPGVYWLQLNDDPTTVKLVVAK